MTTVHIFYTRMQRAVSNAARRVNKICMTAGKVFFFLLENTFIPAVEIFVLCLRFYDGRDDMAARVNIRR